MLITTTLLLAIDACEDGIAAFLVKFPEGEATWCELVEAAETEE